MEFVKKRFTGLIHPREAWKISQTFDQHKSYLVIGQKGPIVSPGPILSGVAACLNIARTQTFVECTKRPFREKRFIGNANNDQQWENSLFVISDGDF
jgi:hypothetical protein